MSEREGATAPTENQIEPGPTEKLRERGKSETEKTVPGAENPASTEIKEETNPNTE
jgi:hypothetical protein